ncbi:MAG: hypothetical protein DRP57_12550 [Spirochaetes bacterium]|nr:MAG: hypothetical protein DRP57_12550 [Spirochaetota bacterium]
MVFSCEVGFIKPEMEIYSFCINSLKVKPAYALLIDDDERNLKGAERAGLKTFLFKPGATEPGEIAELFGLPH